MLVVISDTHLSDGTTGRTIGASAFRDFRDRLREIAVDASWRADGRYRPIEQYDLILLGDVFDLIRSTRWTTEDTVRPWDHPQTRDFIEKVDQITDAILAENAEAAEHIRNLRDLPILIPPELDGEPLESIEPQFMVPVPARIHYMVGNHDWFYHVYDPDWPKYNDIRQKVVDALGLFNPADQPFPFDPETDAYPQLVDTLLNHKVLARHGDIYDPFNYNKEKGRVASTIGDAMVVELFNEFPSRLREEAGGAFPQEFLDGVDRLVNVRPSLFVPVWIESLMRQHNIGYYRTDVVKTLWDTLADNFIQKDFVRAQNTASWRDQFDITKLLLRIIKALSFRWVARVASVAKYFTRGHQDSLAEYALKEEWIVTGKANFVIYGHTHHTETVPLATKTNADGIAVDQVYFNSGTWMPVYEPTLGGVSNRHFLSYNKMTYVTFFCDDERSGRPYESWSGTLANKQHVKAKPPTPLRMPSTDHQMI